MTRPTVPLFHENRIPDLQLTNENLNEDIYRVVEEAELNEAQEKKLERECPCEYRLIVRKDRLEKIAEDMVAHFLGRGSRGKAMVVSIDKATAVSMYDKVQKYWKRRVKQLRTELENADAVQRAVIEEKLRYVEETDMAVVVSQDQNDIDEMRKKGLNIAPHRGRMMKENLDEKFKDPDDLFRIVVV